MATDVDICNLALARIEADGIENFDQTTPQAIRCRELYPLLRDSLLENYAWGFARVQNALAPVDVEHPEWEYVYDYPNDCLRVHYLIREGVNYPVVSDGFIWSMVARWPSQPYIVEASRDGYRKYILTNQEEAQISYTFRQENTTLYTPLFIELLAWKLAIDLSIPLGGDSAARHRSTAAQMFQQVWQQALAMDANQSVTLPNLPRSVAARGGYSGARQFPYWRR